MKKMAPEESLRELKRRDFYNRGGIPLLALPETRIAIETAASRLREACAIRKCSVDAALDEVARRAETTARDFVTSARGLTAEILAGRWPRG